MRHVQLAYASYAALLALFEITSLLGVGMRGEGDQEDRPSSIADLVVGADRERKVALRYDCFVLRFVL